MLRGGMVYNTWSMSVVSCRKPRYPLGVLLLFTLEKVLCNASNSITNTLYSLSLLLYITVKVGVTIIWWEKIDNLDIN